MVQIHEINGIVRCPCAECETGRTLDVSPSTEQHFYGEFDVEAARAEAGRARGPWRPTTYGW